jgi:tetratricopeptide (TPR) repeat protein
MPLSTFIQAHTHALRAFLDGDSAGPLYVRSSAEAELLAARILAALQEGPLSDELCFAHTGVFGDAAEFYAAAAQGVRENLHAHRAELSRLGVSLPEARLLQMATIEVGLSPELAFAEFCERAARELAHVCAQLVLVLHAEAESDHAAFHASTARLASACAAASVKFIVLTSAAARPAAPPALQRFNVVDGPSADLQAFALVPERRVLLVRSPSAELEWSVQWAQLHATSHEVVMLRLRPTEPAAGTAGIAQAAVSALVAHLEQRRIAVAARADLKSVVQFADQCERFAAQCGRASHGLCVVLTVHSRAGADLASFALELVRAAASPRVHYVIIDADGACRLPPLSAAPSRVQCCDVVLDAAAIEAGLREQLASPSLPPQERIQYLGACAVLNVTRGDFIAATKLQEEQLALCEQAGDPGAALQPWLGIGDGYYAQGRWAEAEAAYTRALTLALDQRRDPMIAQALLRLGNTLLRSERWDEAVDTYRAAADWHDKTGHPLWTCYALSWLGEAQRRAGHLEAAERTWRDALDRQLALSDQSDPSAAAELMERLARLDAQKRAAGGPAPSEALRERSAYVPEQP